ncbi:MAG: hypothetical protein EA427_02390 [Spirochaetaceae bacterium]|nr:MAG: hypothetical protein EA427_02390 [Spirochaetaceae bacterium]
MTIESPTEEQIQKSIRLTMLSAASFSIWFQVCAPQQIFNIFVGTFLLPSDGALGLLVGTISAMSVFQLASIFVYRYLPRRKTFWFVMTLAHRLNGFVLAAVAFAVGRGMSREVGYAVVFIAMSVSWMLAQVSGSGWWSWMADLFPERIRSSVFGRRSAVTAVTNLVWFFTVTGILNFLDQRHVYDFFAVIFLIGGIGGVTDILLHSKLPEPSRRSAVIPAAQRLEGAFADFSVPLRDATFRRFVFSAGLALAGLSMVLPFIPTFITAERGLGARPIWMAFQFGILQLTWLLMVPVWGIMMDRFGKRAVVIIGLSYSLHWLGYLVITAANYHYMIPLISAIGGLIAPAFWEGINQWSIVLARVDQRISYVAWFWTGVGLATAVGSYAGGALLELFASVTPARIGIVILGPLQYVILISLVIVATGAVLLSRIPEPSGRHIGFVVRLMSNPNFFRTFSSMQVMSQPRDSDQVTRALRSIDSGSGEIAVDEVVARMHDPDPEVRAEAARALGRIRASEATEALILALRDLTSSVRPEAAIALGRIGDRRALPYLLDALNDPSEELQDGAAWALGEIGDDTATEQLLALFRRIRSERVSASTAAAMSRLGRFEAAWEIIPRMHETRNPILRTQLAIALGNLLGRPGEFYRLVSGSGAERSERRKRLFLDAKRGAVHLVGAEEPGLDRTSRREEITALRTAIEAARGGFEAGRPERSLLLLREAADRVVTVLGGVANLEDASVAPFFASRPRLSLWWWFLRQADELVSSAELGGNVAAAEPGGGTAVARQDSSVEALDVLLGVFFIAQYRSETAPVESMPVKRLKDTA